MNSQQLLKSLNEESHRNHLSKSAIIEPSSPQSPAMLGNQFVPHMEMEQMSDPPEYFVEMLNHQRKKKIVSQLVSDAIQKARKKRERNAYLLFGQGQEGYLGQLAEVLENKNQFSYKWVSQAITKRQQKVNGELQNGGLIVQRDRAIKKKSQIEVLEEFDRARLVKIKEGNIRSKLDYLNTKLEQMDKIDNLSNSPKQDKSLLKKAEEHVFSEYRLSSQKTKIAQDYIKHMAEQRRRREKRERKRSEKQRRQEDKRVMEIKQAQVLKQKQKREGIVNRMLFRKKKREDEEKQITERQEKVEKFLSAYRKQKPLFQKINDSYEKNVGKSQRYHEEKLKQIKEKKKSYSLNDITDHQKKYAQMKKKQNEKKSQQLQMYLKSLKANNKKYFRGSIHEVVEMVDKEAKQKDISLYEIGKGKTNRRSQYSKRVRDEHKPKIDDQKKKQLLKAIEAEELKKKKLRKIYRPIEGQNGQEVGLKSYYQQIKNADAKKEGIKFLEYAKMKKRKYIEEQSQEEQEQTVNALKQQQSQKEKHTDSDLWELRAKYIQQISHQISSPKQFEQLKVNFENLDDKAAKKEQILKHSNMTMEEYLHQKNALDHFYLESIKNKMKWLQ